MTMPRLIPFSPMLLHALLFLATLLAATDARAQSCERGGNPMINFGDISALPTVQTDAMDNLSLTCTGERGREVRVCVGITNGAPDNGLSPRRMANRSARLDYQVYRDAARTQPWGSRAGAGTAQALEITSRFDNRGQLDLLVAFYGRIFPGQRGLPDGTYNSRMRGSEVTLSYNAAAPCSTIGGNRRQFQLRARAKVPGECRIDANDLSFGGRITLASAVDASSTLAVTCTLDAPYSISLDGGVIGNDVNNRAMGLDGGPPAVIGYQLYSDPGRSSVWGTRNADMVDGTGNGFTQSWTAYGRVPVQPTPPAGLYSDTVTATVEY